MGQHFGRSEFKAIKNVWIFNPRLNVVYTLPISKVAPEVIMEVEGMVIGY